MSIDQLTQNLIEQYSFISGKPKSAISVTDYMAFRSQAIEEYNNGLCEMQGSYENLKENYTTAENISHYVEVPSNETMPAKNAEDKTNIKTDAKEPSNKMTFATYVKGQSNKSPTITSEKQSNVKRFDEKHDSMLKLLKTIEG